MAVNVGYSIGFGYPTEQYDPYLWFSIVYVLVRIPGCDAIFLYFVPLSEAKSLALNMFSKTKIGSSFVAVALGFFANKISEDRDNWFTDLIQAKAFEDNMENQNILEVIKDFLIYYESPIRAVGCWVIWVGIMIAYSSVGLGWPFVQALYFAISTLSTGGLWALPPDAPEWMWGLTGFFAMLGVPMMAVAMATLATHLIDQGDLEETKAQIVEDVTGEELLMLRKFGLENGDGVIDSAEFIILCMVRMGQDPKLIEFIANRFKELDDDDSGYLTIEEITGGKYFLKNGQICSKKGEVLAVKGMKQFSPKELRSGQSGDTGDEESPKEKLGQ